ncbi:hypothetical protein [Myceligenerans pegani]|uniref:Uncharacterized protein n=1 Tax=Myceligenerans pegani TaxID=2776917 RepID=A0ABR9N1W8_9MICO|nr:hypothetical protein [Myceligenerans sp. TRM 65318]MBE1877649.1 hypothetical protein [Myceligenerans sp. TRM 65318]MBE3019920.1 hypothetical protein [Myceligenerans sp. TRM 65318]
MSKHLQRGARGLFAGAATAALLLGGAATASADPIDPGTGLVDLNRTVDAVGSDTTQDLNNGLAAVVERNGQLIFGSWDAIGSATIQTRSGGPVFDRPNGSGSGFNALGAAWTSGLWNGVQLSPADIQVSRSSSAPSSIDPNGTYSYVPLAVDAVTYAVAGDNTTVPRDLTEAQLIDIYSSDNGDTVTIDGTVYTVGIEGSGADIVPFIPQAGSGTRSFWLSTALDGVPVGTAVSDTYSGGSVQEHDGAVLAAVENAIAPYSIAQYIAQGNSAQLETLYPVTVNDRRNGAELATVNGVEPLADGVLNTEFPLARPVFTVVPHAAIVAGSDVEYLFSGAAGAVYNAASTAGTFTIEDFGFGSLINRGTGVNGVQIADLGFYEAGDTESYRRN